MSSEQQTVPQDIYVILRDFRQNGMLSPYLRNLMVERRNQFNLTRHQLARLLRTSPQTVGYWENGQTRRCNITHRTNIANFLTGAFHRISASAPRPVTAKRNVKRIPGHALSSFLRNQRKQEKIVVFTFAN